MYTMYFHLYSMLNCLLIGSLSSPGLLHLYSIVKVKDSNRSTFWTLLCDLLSLSSCQKLSILQVSCNK